MSTTTNTDTAAVPQHNPSAFSPEDRAEMMLAAAHGLYGPGGAAEVRPLRIGRRPGLSPEEQERYDRGMANNWSLESNIHELSSRRRKPVRYALGYMAELLRALGEDARLDAAGFTPEFEAALFKGFEQELVEIQQLIVLGELADCEVLGKVIRGRLAAMLMAADTAQDWWLFSRALRALPAWVIGAGQALELEAKVIKHDRQAAHRPQFDYPASDAAASDAIARNMTPPSRADRRRVDALLRKALKSKEREAEKRIG